MHPIVKKAQEGPARLTKSEKIIFDCVRTLEDTVRNKESGTILFPSYRGDERFLKYALVTDFVCPFFPMETLNSLQEMGILSDLHFIFLNYQYSNNPIIRNVFTDEEIKSQGYDASRFNGHDFPIATYSLERINNFLGNEQEIVSFTTNLIAKYKNLSLGEGGIIFENKDRIGCIDISRETKQGKFLFLKTLMDQQSKEGKQDTLVTESELKAFGCPNINFTDSYSKINTENLKNSSYIIQKSGTGYKLRKR